MAIDIRRHEFISLLGGTAASWPLVHAQRRAMPVVGVMNSGSPAAQSRATAADQFTVWPASAWATPRPWPSKSFFDMPAYSSASSAAQAIYSSIV
jgi:hypothetical protein